MDAEQRARSGHLGRHAGTLEGQGESRAESVAERVQAHIGRAVEQLQAGEPGGHGHRIGGEGAAMGHRRLARPGVEHRHQLALAGHRADRQAAADDLSEHDEVGVEIPERVRAAVGEAEGDHFVDDQHDAEPPRGLAQRLGEGGSRRDHADPRRHRVEQHGGEAVAVGL